MIVPQSPMLRESVLQEHRVDWWYRKAGFPRERSEYRIEPEQFGEDRERGLSLDKITGDDQTLLDEYEEALAEKSEPVIRSSWAQTDDDFLDEVVSLAGLTPGETASVSWVASGNPLLGEWAVRLGQSLGMGRDAARKHWSRAKAKLRKTWAVEPPKRKHDPLRREIRGAGASHWRAYPNPQHAFRPRFETWTDHE
jgi:hypothetical protein